MSLILGVLGRIPVIGWVIAVVGGIVTPVVGDFAARQIRD